MNGPHATVYVDNSVISLITELREGAWTVRQDEIDGLDQLCDDPSLEFVSSEQTFREFDRAAGRLRVALKLLARLMGLSVVAMQPIAVPNAKVMVVGGRSQIIAPAVRSDDFYEKLRGVFTDDDARHILNAVRADCDYFLTMDDKTILRPAREKGSALVDLCGPIAFVSPAELAARRPMPAAGS